MSPTLLTNYPGQLLNYVEIVYQRGERELANESPPEMAGRVSVAAVRPGDPRSMTDRKSVV